MVSKIGDFIGLGNLIISCCLFFFTFLLCTQRRKISQLWSRMGAISCTLYPREWRLELITFEILAAERLRLMGFDNRLIIDCFANVVNILIWLFSTNDRLRSAKYESNYLENPFPEIKGVNLLSKTHRNDKSNLKPMTVLQE